MRDIPRMISDSELFTPHYLDTQLLTPSFSIEENSCDRHLLHDKSYDVSPINMEGTFPLLSTSLPVIWPSNSSGDPTLCYSSPMQVMYGMLPYWMATPTIANSPLLSTPAACADNPSAPTSSAPSGITVRPHTEPLYEWIKSHEKDPYPTRREKEILARVCGMTARQIEHWFANARRRMKKMQNSKRLRSSTDSTADRDDETATLTSSFSSASSTEDSLLTPTSSSSLIVTTVPDKQDDRPEIKKPKGIWSIISTLQ